MKGILILSLLSCLLAAYKAKIYKRCDLARDLMARGVKPLHQAKRAVQLATEAQLAAEVHISALQKEFQLERDVRKSCVATTDVLSSRIREQDERQECSPAGVCMAQYESNFNTWAFNGGNSNGSSDYGIFQRNKSWCKDNRHSSENACNVMCNKFMNDDIDDDVHCAKTVVKDPNGMSAWVAWVKHCKDLDLSKYLASCKL
ncbi:uncharacterized protein PS065_006631 [Dugong dugon]